MSLDFQQLTSDIEKMARAAGSRNVTRQTLLDEVLLFLHNNATAWDALEDAYQTIVKNVLQATSHQPYPGGSARPLTPRVTPLDAIIDTHPADLPPEATIISVDGSQIVPDRHAPYVYYLINTGGIVYHHGSGQAPVTFSTPTLEFPDETDLSDTRFSNPTSISIERDQAEMEELARQTVANRGQDGPLLAIMDQRLLYVPIGELAPQFKEKVIKEWQLGMTTIKNAGGLLVGYIDRPAKSSVLAMLRQIHPSWSAEEPNSLGDWAGLTDADLFGKLLGPGARSIVFADVSHANTRFKKEKKHNEVCFFYLNTSQLPGEENANIARVDLPMWVAEDEMAVQMVHELIADQCKILGRYPYVLTRADEMAVVGKQDQAELEFRIGRMMDRFGVQFSSTAKQLTKDIARGGQRSHEM